MTKHRRMTADEFTKAAAKFLDYHTLTRISFQGWEIVGLADDNTCVLLGSLDLADMVLDYLKSHPTPNTW